jgi:hydroxymethylglutaryl-CoA lyase
MKLPASVKIVEVGPRDGLQNEPNSVPLTAKLDFIDRLGAAGLRHIEATSFVNPKRIPQLADAVELMQQLQRRPGIEYSALVPNLKGLERAREARLERIAVFTAASETFTQKNIGMTIDESLRTFGEVARAARSAGMSVRGYVSTCFGCPYEGAVDARRVLAVTLALLDMGCDEVSLGDTIGVAAPTDVEQVVGGMLADVPPERLALHFHDTSGTALANVMAGLELGVTTFDASAGGLGGCPYAPGAAGNLATEDLVYLLDRMGVASGVDLHELARASLAIEEIVGRPLPSRQLQRVRKKI